MNQQASVYQQAIYKWVAQGSGHGIVQAVPGSGKTTTLEAVSRLLNPSDRSIFMAFNKDIAEELARRLPKHVETSTLNAFGFHLIINSFTARYGKRVNLELDDKKYVKLAQEHVKDTYGFLLDDPDDEETAARYEAIMEQTQALVEMAMRTMTVGQQYRDEAALRAMATLYDLDVSEFAATWPLVGDIIKEGFLLLRDKRIWAFADQIAFPIIMNLPFPAYDWVLIDETQDLNALMVEMVARIVKASQKAGRTCRTLWVGDRRQSLYMFNGALPDSMDQIMSRFGASEMPLSICYRCAKSHVDMAASLYPGIESHQDAPEGTVTLLCVKERVVMEARAGDWMICRTTRPVVEMAFALIRAGKPATVLGKSIGQGLISLLGKISKQRHFAFIRLDEYAQQYIERESAKLSRKLDPDKADERIAALVDQVETLLAIRDGSGCRSLDCMKDSINHMFTDKKSTEMVTLATIHKAKGRQAPRVFVLDYDNVEGRWAHTPEQLAQERNAHYVALTRAVYEAGNPASGHLFLVRG